MGLAVVTIVFWSLLTVYVLLWLDPNAVLSSCAVGLHGADRYCTSVDAVGVWLPRAIGFLGMAIVGTLLILHRRHRLGSIRNFLTPRPGL